MAGIRAILNKTIRSITTWPDARNWSQCLAVSAAYVLVVLLLGVASGSLRFELYNGPPGRLFRFAAIAFLVPCLSEELLFRVALLPDPRQPASLRYRLVRAVAAVALFVAWHPLNGLFLKTQARQVFLDPGFLMLAALLGVCCSVLYMRTSSIWPATLVHWVSVVCWKAFLGGRIFGANSVCL